VGVCDDGDKAGGAADGATGGAGGGDMRVQIAACCKQIVGFCDDGDKGERMMGHVCVYNVCDVPAISVCPVPAN